MGTTQYAIEDLEPADADRVRGGEDSAPAADKKEEKKSKKSRISG